MTQDLTEVNVAFMKVNKNNQNHRLLNKHEYITTKCTDLFSNIMKELLKTIIIYLM